MEKYFVQHRVFDGAILINKQRDRSTVNCFGIVGKTSTKKKISKSLRIGSIVMDTRGNAIEVVAIWQIQPHYSQVWPNYEKWPKGQTKAIKQLLKTQPMQDKLADKWAVQITSPQDAERLQALFPNGRIAYSNYDFVFCWQLKSVPYPDLCLYPNGGNAWSYGRKSFLSNPPHDSTIYTITELENLLK